MALIFGCSTIVVAFSLVSLAFLIVATITAPATSALGLAEAESIRYGVFGYCSTTSSTCVTGTPAYDVTSITKLTDWKMDDSARDTLVKILIVTPVTAALTLVSFLFNFFSHFKIFGRCLCFYLTCFTFTLLAFFASALTVIVTFLLFYPHVKWPAWLLVGSAALNLLSVPLVFFAMRTSPNSSADEEDDEMEDHNLTDLSDGGNFKTTESFGLNNYSSTNQYSQRSTEKLQQESMAVKVITDDSSISADQFEKVSVHDYSRAGNAVNNAAFRRYDYQGSSSVTSAQAYTEGTPNLVSSQNYNKGGAVRSEAPAFQPQSVNPDTATTYPSAQYGSSSTDVLDRPDVLYSHDSSSMHSQQISSQKQPISNPIVQSSGEVTPYPHSVFQNTTTGTNTALTSNPPLAVDEAAIPPEDSEYDINDNDSDFTSVSQRAANPRYYRNFQQGPSLFPNQPMNPTQQQQQQQQPLPQGYQYQQQQQQHQQASHMLASPQQPQPTSTYSGYAQYQQPQQLQQTYIPKVQKVDTSDYLLSHNPDFAIGGAPFQKPYARKSSSSSPGTAPLSGGYRPAYKKRINSGSQLPAASQSADSPYSFR